MNQQPDPVGDRLAAEFREAHAAQRAKGLETYGHPLPVVSDRPGGHYRDALQELVDLGMYVTALEMDRERLRASVDRLVAALEAVVAARDKADIWYSSAEYQYRADEMFRAARYALRHARGEEAGP